MYGEDVKCPFGHDTAAKCQAQIDAVRVFLVNEDSNDDPLEFYLRGCFDIHHNNLLSKIGAWLKMELEEMKKLLGEQGRLTCTGYHIFVTQLLEYRISNYGDDDDEAF